MQRGSSMGNDRTPAEGDRARTSLLVNLVHVSKLCVLVILKDPPMTRPVM